MPPDPMWQAAKVEHKRPQEIAGKLKTCEHHPGLRPFPFSKIEPSATQPGVATPVSQSALVRTAAYSTPCLIITSIRFFVSTW
jgi:hypothetical protein